METDTFVPSLFLRRSRCSSLKPRQPSLAIMASLLFHGCLIMAGQRGANAQPSDTGEDYFNQGDSLHGEKLTVDTGIGLTDRLLKSLHLNAAISNRIAHRMPYLTDHGDHPVTESDTQEEQRLLQKRVFCNGFTGCGGRFRGRRRQYQQKQKKSTPRRMLLMMKRPFCNTHGCFNGRKRSWEFASKLNNERDTFMQRHPDSIDDANKHRDIGDSRLQNIEAHLSQNLAKRLFCNGWGGCKSSGKRSSSFPEVRHALDLPENFDFITALNKPKRFFAAQYDLSAQQFADDMSS